MVHWRVTDEVSQFERDKTGAAVGACWARIDDAGESKLSPIELTAEILTTTLLPADTPSHWSINDI